MQPLNQQPKQNHFKKIITQVLMMLLTIILLAIVIFGIIAVVWVSIILYNNFDFWEASSIVFIILGLTPCFIIVMLWSTKMSLVINKSWLSKIHCTKLIKTIKSTKWKWAIWLTLVVSLLFALIGGVGTVVFGNHNLIHHIAVQNLKNEELLTADLKSKALDTIDINEISIDEINKQKSLLNLEEVKNYEQILEQQKNFLMNGTKKFMFQRTFGLTDQKNIPFDEILKANRQALEQQIEIENYAIENELDHQFYQTNLIKLPAIDKYQAGTLIRKHNFKTNLQSNYDLVLTQQENKKYLLSIKIWAHDWTQKLVAFGRETYILYI
ncbi:hypothetical protein [Williamsoniiplasma lucivorax]|uniref:Uncharacterized protein n=1 Tax=Williamsoniiplasma lucivorax TaxID=209274 RepID=A0A2S5R9Z2_9MOLU|nr:hypothetical protein [Williamsoniiplasma lucivorax]PPE04149.1 hypothetical protein ELUCI_v1c09290 [Williamsoniiplasma lucivorax]